MSGAEAGTGSGAEAGTAANAGGDGTTGVGDGAYRIVAPAPGDAAVLERRDFTPPDPGPGEVRIRHTAVGVNFIDVYFRTGLYPWPVEKDLVPGSEATGVIDAVGADVAGLAPGERVVYTLPNGAYATHRVIDAAHVVRLPDGVDDETAAAIMLKGLTASYLLNDSYAVQAGDTVLFHAAAGGVGSLAGQWLKAKGATVIGTAGGAEKCARARERGYDHVVDYRSEDFVEAVKSITDGRGVQAVYDSVGKDTVPGSLDCLARFGTLVCFGQSSGPATEFRISDLAAGSFRLTRPTLFHYTAMRDWLERASGELFGLVADGTLSVPIGQRFALAEVARAHAALESRATSGSTVLTL